MNFRSADAANQIYTLRVCEPLRVFDLLRQQKGTDFWYRNKLVLLLILVLMVQANPSMSYCGNTGSVITAFHNNHYPAIRNLNFNDGQLADLVKI